jgi:hypothetical protein
MADAIRVADQGVEVIRNVLPARFHWLLFGPALILMAAPVVEIAWQAWLFRNAPAQEQPAEAPDHGQIPA